MRTYFGPPGTGKTETLLQIARSEIEAGTPSEEIAYLAFTRRAAREARQRASETLNLNEDQLRHWRTLHSLAARALSVGPDDLMDVDDWRVLGEAVNMRFSDLDEAGRPTSLRGDVGSVVQSAYYLRRARLESFDREALIRDLGSVADRASLFEKSLTAYKQERGKYDYADLLDEAPDDVGARVVILDEAQDLTAQQWRYFQRVARHADRVYCAGDDEQAIFGWAGADVDRFLSLDGERVVLQESRRLPTAAFNVARQISARIRRKQDKEWWPVNDRAGRVVRNADPSRLTLHEDTWLLLVRTRDQLQFWIDLCRRRAVRYVASGKDSVSSRDLLAIAAWERARRGASLDEGDEHLIKEYVTRMNVHEPWYEVMGKMSRSRRDYYRAVMRAHGRDELEQPARIRIETIHGAKGAEADHVALLPDVTQRVYHGLRSNPDAEHRVWYVAVTRCRHTLHVARPFTNLYYGV